MLAVVDTGPLYAAVDTEDPHHERARDTLLRPDLRLFIPAMVVAETAYLISQRLGWHVESMFLAGLEDVDVEAPRSDEWPRIAELVRHYRNFPPGGADASVVVLAERLRTDLIITLDHRHFAAIRPHHALAFRLLPE